MKRRRRGWNLFLFAPGRWLRLEDAGGNPPYPPVPMTAAGLVGVRIVPDHGDGDDTADEPHIVHAARD